MIAVDFVARGGGNATLVPSGEQAHAPLVPQADIINKAKGKGKAPAKNVKGKFKDDASSNLDQLSPEDEERMCSLLFCRCQPPTNDFPLVIQSLTARANAVKMLHSRINLLRKYLASLPSSPLNNNSPDTSTESADPLDHSVLRAIYALTKRIPLVIPADTTTFESESLQQRTEVSLVALLGGISRSVQDAREAGRKFAVVDAQTDKKGSGMLGGMGGMGGSDWGGILNPLHDDEVAGGMAMDDVMELTEDF
jgi:COP9 signalosome complex subunit 6